MRTIRFEFLALAGAPPLVAYVLPGALRSRVGEGPRTRRSRRREFLRTGQCDPSHVGECPRNGAADLHPGIRRGSKDSIDGATGSVSKLSGAE